ncbi:circularly permuted type 2 ATP-grasp protein [Nocardioides convexus]|uniref:circularly permuted type 2 ATP-grasp protein n=1 Tax=Nocardioides convexus TaxID=2712224 RepID=UPI0024186238|nr:circularly permuted type 2 ATP-grasp protein [Nocardioides convexus]
MARGESTSPAGTTRWSARTGRCARRGSGSPRSPPGSTPRTCVAWPRRSPASSRTTASPTPGPASVPPAGGWTRCPSSWTRRPGSTSRSASRSAPSLLNALLADLYGPQTLLARGIVPPAVVLGHRGFTRVVARASTADPRPLVLSATDLGRDADGTWRVLGDRTQAPSGLGYALENRRVLSRVMPELYREADSHRMAPYLWALRSALLQSASGDLPDPRVVVLSPGLHSETHYDQAAIASNLGFPLVQGSDLTVRDGWVLMKTPQRLERVDVILRRVDAAWSDPLEPAR